MMNSANNVARLRSFGIVLGTIYKLTQLLILLIVPLERARRRFEKVPIETRFKLINDANAIKLLHLYFIYSR